MGGSAPRSALCISAELDVVDVSKLLGARFPWPPGPNRVSPVAARAGHGLTGRVDEAN